MMESINEKQLIGQTAASSPAITSSETESAATGDEMLVSELRQCKIEYKALQKAGRQHPELAVDQEYVAQMGALSRKINSIVEQMKLGKLTKFAMADPVTARLTTSKVLTYEEMVQLTAIGNVTDQAVVALRQVQKGAEVTVRPTITVFVPPQMPKVMDIPQIAGFMAGIRTLQPLQGVQRCKKDPYFVAGGGPKNMATSIMNQNFVPQDAQWVTNLQNLPHEFKDERAAVYEATKSAVENYYCGSGPLIGWFGRIREGKSKPHPMFTLTEAEMQAVFKVLPWAKSRATDWKTATLETILKKVKINPRANSGFPRQKSKALTFPHLIADAHEYYKLMQENKFLKYQEDNPGEFLTIVKNKLDRYMQAEWGKKIRPYYNSNGGKALLNSGAVATYSEQLEGFWENPESCNAHGFSWANGGAQRLYDWVVNHYKQSPPGVYAIGYSDDGLWVIVWVDSDGVRRVWVGDLDIKHCDMSLGNSFQPVMMRHVMAVYGKDAPQGFKNLAAGAVREIWNQVVVLYGPLVYMSRDQVHSGLPGTAEADQVGFAVYYTCMKAAVEGLMKDSPGTDPREIFRVAEGLMEKKLGLTLKPYTWYEFKPNQRDYEWEFLGKRLQLRNGWYVPYVTLDKAVLQCVVPKKAMKGVEGLRAWMERARGLAVTSLWNHPVLFEAGRLQYELYQKQGLKPADELLNEDESEIQFETILGQSMTVTYPNQNYPTLEWVLNLYEPRALTAAGTAAAAHVSGFVTKRTAADVFAEMYGGDDYEQSGKWADASVEVEDLKAKLDVGSGKQDQLRLKPAVTLESQWTPPPLPKEVKEAYNAARLQARERVHQSFKAPVKLREGGKLRGLLRTGARDIKYEAGFSKDLAERFDAAWEEENEAYSIDADDAYEEGSGWVVYDELEDEDFYQKLERDWQTEQKKGRSMIKGPRGGNQ